MSGTYIHPSICIHGDLREKLVLPASLAIARNKTFNARVYNVLGTNYCEFIVPCPNHVSGTN
jgi:hypothetical protein